MTRDQIDKLFQHGEFIEGVRPRELIETHISWVILCDQFAYKIKRPVYYSFLDFSTPERRKYFCQREIELNKRLTDNIYIDVQPITEKNGRLIIGETEGLLVDHAVRMYKLDRSKQMDVLLLENKIADLDILNLAKKIAFFHENTSIIYEKDLMDIQQKFKDLASEKDFLQQNLGLSIGNITNEAVEFSDAFMKENKALLAQRIRGGFFRDCHGDLHSKNIFFLPDPQPFDCIEFNDDLRQIDTLNEIAFLCMDLDAFNRMDLSEAFIKYYNQFFPAINSDEDHSLFVYYKSYRANIRAKVNSLRAKSATTEPDKTRALKLSEKYLLLMNDYIRSL